MKLAIVAVFLAGCTLFHGDNRDHTRDGGTISGDDGDDGCSGPGLPQQVQLLNPLTLACQIFPIGCGGDLDAGIPNWAPCNSTCLGLPEEVCGATPGCRVTMEANHYFGFTVGDPFLGCFPVNLDGSSINGICELLDGSACSSDARCWSVYDAPAGVQCGIEHREACPSGAFVQCVDRDATLPGRCAPGLTSTCVTPAPSCLPGTEPGINDNCYTGICIPQRYCTIPD
ncbi:MAG TPA: hypothetical protein VGM39_03490 [Kofleriaceae bacterium]